MPPATRISRTQYHSVSTMVRYHKERKALKSGNSYTILHAFDSNGLVRGNSAFEFVQRFELGAPLLQDVALDPPWQCLGHLIAYVRASGHGKDIIKFLQGALFGFWHEEENQDKSGEVQAGVEAEGSDGVEGDQEPREAYGEDGGPKQAGCYRPTHTDLTMG